MTRHALREARIVPLRPLLPATIGLLAALALGCGSLENASEDIISAVEDGASGDPAGSRGSSGAVDGVPAARSGAAPVYVMLHTHHYKGNGGYYAPPSEVRDVVEAAVDAGIDDRSTLFFDGILVDKLLDEDPSLIEYVKDHDFAIGYHGEEAHGPYPVVVSVEQLSKRSKGVEQVNQRGYDFDEAVNAVQYRYCHGYKDCEFGSDGYLSRFSGGETDDSVVGGIRLVRQTFGTDIQVLPNHALYNPAITFAFENETNFTLFQGAGIFTYHFLANTGDAELIDQTQSFLGDDTTLFWYMGKLAEKGMEKTQLGLWNMGDFAEKSSGGGKGGGQGGGGRPGAGGDSQGRPPRGGSGGGGRPPRGAGYFGPHLLPFTLPSLPTQGGLGSLTTWLDQAQSGRPGRGGGSSTKGDRPPRGSGSEDARPPRGEGGSNFPPRGEGDETRPPRGEGTNRLGSGDGEAAASRGTRGESHSDVPGEDIKNKANALDRKTPVMVSAKIDGAKNSVVDCINWFKAWESSDRSVELVTPKQLRAKIVDPEVTLDATTTAKAVQEYWNKAPADFLVVGGTYASLADGWEVMARHLAGEGDRIETTNVMGPTGLASELVNGKGTVTGSDVRAAAKAAWAQTKADKYHAMPTTVSVGGTTVGFHQFYWMMSQAIIEGDSAKISVPSAGYAPPFAAMLGDRLGRDNPDQTFWTEVQFWTVKPVTWE